MSPLLPPFLADRLAPFFAWLLQNSAEATLMAAAVLLAQALFRQRLAARWRYALWLPVVLRLMLPALPILPTHLFHLPSRTTTVVPSQPIADFQTRPPQTGMESAFPMMPLDSMPSSQPTASLAKPQKPSWFSNLTTTAAAFAAWLSNTATKAQSALAALAETPTAQGMMRVLRLEILAPLWLIGALALAAATLFHIVRFARLLRRARPCGDAGVLKLAREAAQELGLRRAVPILVTPLVGGPAMVGVFRPRLLLPEGLTAGELRLVLLHELAHVRRGDMPANALLVALQIAHWFNPLLWPVFARMRHDRELACDALVLSGPRAALKNDYAHTLLKLLEAAPPALSRAATPRLVGILETHRHLKQRLSRIMQATPNAYRRSILGLAVITLLIALTLSRTLAGDKSKANAAAEKQTTDVVRKIEAAPPQSSLSPALSSAPSPQAQAALEEKPQDMENGRFAASRKMPSRGDVEHWLRPVLPEAEANALEKELAANPDGLRRAGVADALATLEAHVRLAAYYDSRGWLRPDDLARDIPIVDTPSLRRRLEARLAAKKPWEALARPHVLWLIRHWPDLGAMDEVAKKAHGNDPAAEAALQKAWDEAAALHPANATVRANRDLFFENLHRFKLESDDDSTFEYGWRTVGEKLTPEEVAALERQLAAHPDGVDSEGKPDDLAAWAARVKLWFFYQEKFYREIRQLNEAALVPGGEGLSEPTTREKRNALERKLAASKQPHLLWLIRHHPQSAAYTPGINWTESPALYKEAKAAWLEQVERNPENTSVLSGAARFLERCADHFSPMVYDPAKPYPVAEIRAELDTARQLLQRVLTLAENMEPKEAAKTRYDGYGDLVMLEMQEAVLAERTGHKDEAVAFWRKQLEYTEAAEEAIRVAEPSRQLTIGTGLNNLAQLSMQVRDTGRMQRYGEAQVAEAEKMLKDVRNKETNAHSMDPYSLSWCQPMLTMGHTLQGLAALQRGEVDAAREQLRLAVALPADTPPNGNSIDVVLELAREFLKRGEKETVLTALDGMLKIAEKNMEPSASAKPLSPINQALRNNAIGQIREMRGQVARGEPTELKMMSVFESKPKPAGDAPASTPAKATSPPKILR